MFGAENESTYRLSRKMLHDGIELYIQNPTVNEFLEIIDHRFAIDTGQIDAEVADVIIQYALFKQILYS